jgi:hypothetical protein
VGYLGCFHNLGFLLLLVNLSFGADKPCKIAIGNSLECYFSLANLYAIWALNKGTSGTGSHKHGIGFQLVEAIS